MAASVQGKSLVQLLQGKTAGHRPHVVVEYSANEEAPIRTERWKLMHTTGKRLRQDGYATGKPLPGRTIRLYDSTSGWHSGLVLRSRATRMEVKGLFVDL